MRIQIPHSAHPITRVIVQTPQGPIAGDFTQEHKFFDVDLPAGVTEDEVGVTVEYRHGRKTIESVVLKHAIEKPVDPPAVTDEPSVEDCECGENEACSNCDPEDEIAESDLDE